MILNIIEETNDDGCSNSIVMIMIVMVLMMMIDDDNSRQFLSKLRRIFDSFCRTFWQFDRLCNLRKTSFKVNFN